MQLHPLQQLVHVEARVVVVEPDHEAERDLVGPSGYMKLPPNASVGSGQPSVWMTAVERPLHLPDLLHAEREDLRVGRADLLPLAPRLAEQRRACLRRAR